MAINHENYNPDLKYGASAVTNDIADSAVTTAKIANEAVTGAKLSTDGVGYYTVAVNTGATTAEQSVFGSGGLGVATTITGVWASGSDATAMTVNLVAGGASVAAIALTAQNATALAVGPNAALTDTAVAANTHVFVANSADGNAMVVIAFEA